MQFVEASLYGGAPLFVSGGDAVRVSPRERTRTRARIDRFVHTLEPLLTRRICDVAALARKLRGPGMIVVAVQESQLAQEIDYELSLVYASTDEMRAGGMWSDNWASAACTACDYASACALCVCVRMDARVTALAYYELRYVAAPESSAAAAPICAN